MKKYLPLSNPRTAQSLGDFLSDFKKSWKELNKLSEINDNWRELIGPELFNECKPIKFEKEILTITVNHPQWRQALIYNRETLKERIIKIGINLNAIKIIQNYELKNSSHDKLNANSVWDMHPSRIKAKNMTICQFCNCPTPKGEISRWGKCTFCWRQNK